jgi:NADPH-dependent 2,4-dienoyl-CoA reductase/sulfur reductase-like enzyme
MKKKLLAIGCGGAGMFSLVVASQLRKGKFETIVLSDEPDIYCRCTSSYILSGEAELDDAIQPESMVGDYGLQIVHDKAVRIDRKRREVTTESGAVYSYDRLVIGTGARPFVPPIPGIDGARVSTVRTSDDMRHIERAAEESKSAIVIGAGVIGIEIASALAERGISATLLEGAPTISSMVADAEFAKHLTDHLTAHHIDLRFSASVKEIRDADGHKEVVIAQDGVEQVLATDMVVVATGVRPNLEIVEGTGIETTKQGIVVDRRMRTNDPRIFACGDCVVTHSAVTGERVGSGLASLAIQQSKIVGFQIAGFPIRYSGSTGAFAFRILGKEYALAGLSEEEARKRFRFVIVGHAESTDIYNDLKGKQPLSVKLIFAGPRMRLVGYEAFGNGVIASAEVASFAIGLHLSILKMLHFNYIAHPSLTAWPFMNPLIMATEDAMGVLMGKIKTLFRIG